MANKIRILLVDDHEVVRNGIRLMLSNADDVAITGEAATGEAALELIHQQFFDLALVDLNLPGVSGLDLVKLIRRDSPRTAVLVLSIYAEEIYAVRARKQGAAGYLNKSSSGATLLEAIRRAAAGEKLLGTVTREKSAEIAVPLAPPEAYALLSQREKEVMRLIATGVSLVRIAEQLQLSPSTVTTYRARILEKLKLRGNADIARFTLENGLDD
jgi:DNA-binding NarL/FixJ family response regulator